MNQEQAAHIANSVAIEKQWPEMRRAVAKRKRKYFLFGPACWHVHMMARVSDRFEAIVMIDERTGQVTDAVGKSTAHLHSPPRQKPKH